MILCFYISVIGFLYFLFTNNQNMINRQFMITVILGLLALVNKQK